MRGGVAFAPVPAAAMDWAVLLRVTALSTASDHGIHETRLLVGTDPAATDGFDASQDAAAPYAAPPPGLPRLLTQSPVILVSYKESQSVSGTSLVSQTLVVTYSSDPPLLVNPPDPPSVGLLKAWFDHPEYLDLGRPAALWRDLRAGGGWPKSWTLYIQPSGAFTIPNVTVWWTIMKPVCSRLQFLLRPVSGTGSAATPDSTTWPSSMPQVDLTELASVTFSAPTMATRLELIVQPDPTRMPAGPPAQPLGLWSPRQGAGRVLLTWLKNAEPDLTGYHVYRSTTSGSGYAQLTDIPLPKTKTTFFDTTASSGRTYYYKIAAVNADTCLSALSDELAVTLP